MSEWRLVLNNSLSNQICAIHQGGVGWSQGMNIELYYDPDPSAAKLKIGQMQIRTGQLLYRDLPPDFPVTVELKIGNNTSGQIAMNRYVVLVSSSSGTYYAHYFMNSGYGCEVTVPQGGNDDLTVEIIVRTSGAVNTSNTFLIPPPFAISVASISPAPQTGKVCTVTLNKTVPDSSWKIYSNIFIRSNYKTDGTSSYCHGYKTDMVTRIGANDYGFNKFTLYYPYDSSKPMTSNKGLIQIYFRAELSTTYFESGTYVYFSVQHEFTMTFTDQTDPQVNPTVVLNAIAENPSGMLARYGKYVGGGIGKLTFSLASVACKFGASFSKRTMALYNSNGTLNNKWEYSNTNSFTLSLTNKSDAAWYMVVSITDSAGRVGSATTAVFQAYGYEAPSIIVFSASRCDDDGTANDSGDHCKISFQFKVTPLGNINKKKVTLNAPDGSHVYTGLEYNHGSIYQYISVADTETSYQIDLIVEDDFDEVTRTMRLSTAGVIMDFLYNGKGIGLGKVAESTNMVEVNPEWTFKAEKITIRGQDLATILQSLGYTFPT